MLNLKKILLFIGCFLFVFGPVFRGNAWLDFSLLFSVIIVCIGTSHKPIIPVSFIKVLMPLFLLSFYTILTNLIFQDTSYAELANILIRPIRVLIILAAAYHLYRFFLKYYKDRTSYAIALNAYLVILVHACIMITQFFNPSFKDWLYSFTSTGTFRSAFDYALRMGGLSGGPGGAVLSVVMSLGILLIPFIWGITNKLFLVLTGSAIFFSVLICGRSGLWAIIIFLPIITYMLSPNKVRYFKTLGLVLAALFFLGGIFLGFISANNIIEGELGLINALGRTFDAFIQSREDNQISDETVSVLLNMILFPKDLGVLFLGNPYYLVEGNNLTRQLDSDIGFIRGLWGYGLFGMILFIYPYISLLYQSWRFRTKNKATFFLFFLLLVSLFFHTKESYLYTRMIFPFLALFIPVLSFYNQINHSYEKNS